MESSFSLKDSPPSHPTRPTLIVRESDYVSDAVGRGKMGFGGSHHDQQRGVHSKVDCQYCGRHSVHDGPEVSEGLQSALRVLSVT